MKKILFLLSFAVTFSFASYPTYINYNNSLWKYEEVINPNTSEQGVITELYYIDNGSRLMVYYPVGTFVDNSITYTKRAILSYTQVNLSTECPPPKIIQNGECVTPPPSNCDPLDGKYPTESGSCTDCSSSNSIISRASCVCASMDSTFTPSGNEVTESYIANGKQFNKTTVHCDDGLGSVMNIPIFTEVQDTNTTPPVVPPDTNNTTPPVPNQPSQADVVNALNQISNGTKTTNQALSELNINSKAVESELKKHGLKFDDIFNEIKKGNEAGDKRFKLMDDEFKNAQQWRNMMGSWVDDDRENAKRQLQAIVDVKGAVHGTTNAVNDQGRNIREGLDNILEQLKKGGDGNGTGGDGTKEIVGKLGEILEELKKDNNGTGTNDGNGTKDDGNGTKDDGNGTKGIEDRLDKLIEETNATNQRLTDLKSVFDNNGTVDENSTGSAFSFEDLLPEGGLDWFTNNALNLNFNSSGGGNCECATVELRLANRTFIFPPPELMAIIPFEAIGNLFLAFVYLLGLRSFLRE